MDYKKLVTNLTEYNKLIQGWIDDISCGELADENKSDDWNDGVENALGNVHDALEEYNLLLTNEDEEINIVNLNDYQLLKLCDASDHREEYGFILLNITKHSIKDFQHAIYNAKQKHAEEIEIWGDDWEFIKSELSDFDYYELGFNSMHDYIDF